MPPSQLIRYSCPNANIWALARGVGGLQGDPAATAPSHAWHVTIRKAGPRASEGGIVTGPVGTPAVLMEVGTPAFLSLPTSAFSFLLPQWSSLLPRFLSALSSYPSIASPLSVLSHRVSLPLSPPWPLPASLTSKLLFTSCRASSFSREGPDGKYCGPGGPTVSAGPLSSQLHLGAACGPVRLTD